MSNRFKYTKDSLSGEQAFGILLGCLLLIPLYLIGMGAIVAFLWNSVIVDALHFTAATLNLWTGTGLFILINIIGGAFRSFARSSN